MTFKQNQLTVTNSNDTIPGRIPHVYYEYRKNYLIWVEKQNDYLRMNEPAWFMFEHYNMGKSEDEIISLFIKHYPNYKIKSASDIKNFFRTLHEIEKKENCENQHINQVELSIDTKYFIRRIYRIGKKQVMFAYQDDMVEEIIHPLFRSHEMHYDGIYKHSVTVGFTNNHYFIRYSGKDYEIYGKDETHQLKGKLFMFMANFTHNKKEHDWMMTCHAAAVTKNNKTLLIPAGSGSGKTTLAALLQSQGYSVISDDFVPICFDGMAHYFPAALSVKSGAVDVLKSYYPDLITTPYLYLSTEKLVKYIERGSMSDEDLVPRQVHKVLFINYDPKVPCKFQKLSRFDGIFEILEHSYIVPNARNPLAFFQWSTKIQYYALTYSDPEKMIEKINSLMEDDK